MPPTVPEAQVRDPGALRSPCLGARWHDGWMSISDHEGFPGRRESAASVDGRRDDAPPGLFFSRQGHWFHDGDRIFHEGLAGLLHRSVARDDDGALIVTTGRDRLPCVAEDAPLIIHACDVGDDGVVAYSSRGDRVGVVVIVVGADGRWRAPLRGMWGLLTRSVMQQLEPLVDEADGGAMVLRCGTNTITLRSLDTDWGAAPALS